jgi:hypothetical protein
MARRPPPVGAGLAPKGQELAMASKNRRGRRLFRNFDFLSAFMASLFGPRMEPKPIPVRAKRR